MTRLRVITRTHRVRWLWRWRRQSPTGS